MFRCLPPALTAQQARRQKQDRPQQREYTLAGDAQDTKWDRDHPDDRPQQERQQCQRPAQYQQQQPQQELQHAATPTADTVVTDCSPRASRGSSPLRPIARRANKRRVKPLAPARPSSRVASQPPGPGPRAKISLKALIDQLISVSCVRPCCS